VQTTPLSLWPSIGDLTVCRIFKKPGTAASLRKVGKPEWVSWKSGQWRSNFTCGRNSIYPLQFPFPSPIWTQFGTEDLHIMPWGGLTVKLTKLQRPPLAWVPSKTLGGSLAMSSYGHMFFKKIAKLYFNHIWLSTIEVVRQLIIKILCYFSGFCDVCGICQLF